MSTYRRYQKSSAKPGDIVVRLYESGDQIRGYLRKVAEPGEEDAIFPGEEMKPDVAFRMAENKLTDQKNKSIFVELTVGVDWDPAWGELR